MIDKRKSPRLKTSLEIVWKKVGQDSRGDVSKIDKSTDISLGGFSITSRNILKPGDRIHLVIRFGSNAIESTARVVWVRQRPVVDKNGMLIFDIGFEFVHVCEEDKENIQRFIFEGFNK